MTTAINNKIEYTVFTNVEDVDMSSIDIYGEIIPDTYGGGLVQGKPNRMSFYKSGTMVSRHSLTAMLMDLNYSIQDYNMRTSADAEVLVYLGKYADDELFDVTENTVTIKWLSAEYVCKLFRDISSGLLFWAIIDQN